MSDILDERVNRNGVKLKETAPDGGVYLLKRITEELSSIQDEISKIKSDITRLSTNAASSPLGSILKPLVPAAAGIAAAATVVAAVSSAETAEPQKEAEGFFGAADETDETIALSDDEILNILNNPNFEKNPENGAEDEAENQETAEAANVNDIVINLENEPEMAADSSPEQAESGATDISDIAINLDTEPEMSAGVPDAENAIWNQIAQTSETPEEQAEPRSIDEVAEENIAELNHAGSAENAVEEIKADEDEENFSFDFDDEEEDEFGLEGQDEDAPVENEEAKEEVLADTDAAKLREYSGDLATGEADSTSIVQEADKIDEEPPFPHGEIDTSTLIDAPLNETEKDFDVLPDIDLPKDIELPAEETAPEISDEEAALLQTQLSDAVEVSDEVVETSIDLTPEDVVLDSNDIANTIDESAFDTSDIPIAQEEITELENAGASAPETEAAEESAFDLPADITDAVLDSNEPVPDEDADFQMPVSENFDMPLSVPDDIAGTVLESGEPELDSGEDAAKTESSPNPDANDLSSSLKQDVKNLLSYMDNLLENLPDSKIEEFARSEKYNLYKKIFIELGLA